MDIFRTNIRHIVLAIKSSEERQRKCKEELTNVFRMVQKHPNSDASKKISFTLFTKQILSELKETDEKNKALRTNLREILIKICEQKFMNTEKTNEIPIVSKKRLTSKNPSQISNIQQSHHAERQIHVISSKYLSNNEIRKIKIRDWTSNISPTTDTNLMDQKASVKLKKCLITFSTFTGRRIIIRLGVG